MNITFNDRDEFHRKQIAEKAIQLLQADMDISPLVIDGSWGTGKTEFCKKLINLMAEQETHHLIYVDAFQADHADEPLLTVLAEVIKIIPTEDEQNSFIQKALPAARYGLKTIAKAGIAHLLRQDAADVVDEFDKEIQQAANKAIDASVESLLKDHVKASESLNTLQKTLEELADEKPIILFIDELDRCRPDFAVNMLEIIKHTFDVKGVQFVLVTNTQQLKASINHCYGETVDAQRYLDKFLKFSFQLPTIQNSNSYDETTVSLAHYKNLVGATRQLGSLELYQRGFTQIVERLIKTNSLSLREVETFVRHLEIYSTLKEEGNLSKNIIYGYKVLTLLSIYIFCFNPKISESIVNKNLDIKDIAELLRVTELSQYQDNQRVDDFELICYMLSSGAYKNSEQFSPRTPEEKEMWDNSMTSYFNGSFFHMPDDGVVRILEDAINALTLN